MNFGPLIPQEMDRIVAFLEGKKIPFEIHFNREEAQKELNSQNIDNNLGLAEWRTRTYLAQHFYVEIDDVYLINNPKVKKEVMEFITKESHMDIRTERTDEENTIPLRKESFMEKRGRRNKMIQKVMAVIFLISMLYGLIASIMK